MATADSKERIQDLAGEKRGGGRLEKSMLVGLTSENV